MYPPPPPYTPLASLELVADILQEPIQLNGVLPEDVAAEAGQALEPVGDVGVSMLQPLLLGVAQRLNDAVYRGEGQGVESGMSEG